MNHPTQFKETLEIMRTKILNVDPRFVAQVRPLFESYLNDHEAFMMQREASAKGGEEKNHYSGWFALKSCGYKNRKMTYAGQETATRPESQEDLIITDDPKWDMTPHWWDEEGSKISPDDEFINVIDMTAAVTRNGGWCSSGSIEHRDQMIFASKFPNCIGHIIIQDTPGGSAYSKNDYQQGIAAARAAGQPVLVWIDGMSASAGIAAAVQADEIYVQHPGCEVGCIGTMAAFYTLADGTEDEYGYVYHELYDPESFDKNAEFRELANNGNPDPFLEELAEDGREFREMVRKCRPGMTDGMLHGKMFKARDLMGILVDGVKSFDEVVERLISLRGGEQLIDHSQDTPSEEAVNGTEEPNSPDPSPEGPVSPDSPDSPEDPDSKCGDKDNGCGDKPEDKCGDKDNANNNPDSQESHNNSKMKQYENINALLKVEELAVKEDGGFYVNGAYAEALDEAIAEAKQNAELLKANEETVTSLNGKINSLKDEKANLETEVANLKAENENLGKQLEEAKQATADAQDAQHSAAQSSEQSLTAKDEEIANLNKQVEDLKAELASKEAELEEVSKAAPQAQTPAPADNENQNPGMENNEGAHHFYKAEMNAAERREALQQRMKNLQKKF